MSGREEDTDTPLVTPTPWPDRLLDSSRNGSVVQNEGYEPVLSTGERERFEPESEQKENILRYIWLAISIALGLISGSLYGFGRYAVALRGALQATQPQVQSLGICMDLGNYVGHPITGWIYDRWGPRVSCSLAAVIVFSSYATIHHCVNNPDVRYLWWLLTISFSGVGFGSGLGYIAGLGTVTSKFEGTWAVGWVAAGYGLSSTLVALTYTLVGLSRIFAVLAVLVAVFNLAGAAAFSNHPLQTTEMEEAENDESEMNEGEGQCTDDREGSSPLHSLSDEPLLASQADRLEPHTVWNTWRKFDFWLLVVAFACVIGCGLFVINNVSSMVQSIGLPDSVAGKLVIFLSVCNVSGRVIAGLLVSQRQQLKFLRIAALLMTLGLSTSALVGGVVTLLWTVACVAVAYGASWVLVVGVLAEYYGKDHFGKDYGILAVGPALSGLCFNSISAVFYQNHVTDESGICTGSGCYKAPLLFTTGAALLGLVLLTPLPGGVRSANH